MNPYLNPGISRYLANHDDAHNKNSHNSCGLLPKLPSLQRQSSQSSTEGLSCNDFFSTENISTPKLMPTTTTPKLLPTNTTPTLAATTAFDATGNQVLREVDDRLVFLNDDSLIPPQSMTPLNVDNEPAFFLQQSSPSSGLATPSSTASNDAKRNSFSNLSKLQIPSSPQSSVSQLSKNIPAENPTLTVPKTKPYGSLTDRSTSNHTSVETSHFRGEYLPEPSHITSPIEAVSSLSPDQIQALPFSFRRRVKSVLSGTASETDLRTVGDNIDTILELSGSASSKDSTPIGTTPAMAIGHKRVANLQRDSPSVSPNTSTFFNYSQPESLLSPSSQSYLRQQNSDALSFSASSHKKLHRAATMYPAVSSRKVGSLSSRHNSVSASNLRGNISRSASLSSANNSPALQFLTRIASNTFSPSAASNSECEDMGEQIGDYVIGKMIGYGGFSEVKEAHTIDDTGAKKTKAVKIVRKLPQNAPFRNPDIVGDEEDRLEKLHEEFDHEVLLWKTLDHPNILKLLCVHDNDHATYCFTEKITGGTLFDLIKLSKHKGLPTAECIDFSKQLAAALLYLHETQKIVHRDVKPENCLIEIEKDGKKRLVVCDFGMSDYFGIENNDEEDCDMEILDNDQFGVSHYGQKIGPSRTSSILNQYHGKKSETSSKVSSTKPSRQNSLLSGNHNNSSQFSGISSSVSSLSFTTDNNIGSLPYASPELLLSPSPIFHPTIDIWAYGVLVYFMFKGSLPWQHPLAPKLREMILKGDWQPNEFEAHVFQKLLNESGNSEDHSRLKAIAEKITNLVANCLQIDPEKRFTIRQIVEYDWGV